jgi:hypothetical protein
MHNMIYYGFHSRVSNAGYARNRCDARVFRENQR